MKFTTKELDIISEALSRFEGGEISSETEHTQEEIDALQERFSEILGY